MKSTRPVKFHEMLEKLIEVKGLRRNRKKICLDVGITTSALTQYLNQQANPSFVTLTKLAEFFEVTLDYLVYGEHNLSAETVDYGPVFHYMDKSLADLQAKTDEQTFIFSRISRILADRIKEAAKEVATESTLPAGLMKDDETMVLELYSKESWIISMNLQYDMKDSKTPGRFMEIVGKNLIRGHSYKFLLPAIRDWEPVVTKFLNLLQKQCGDIVYELCTFKVSDSPIISGCGFYRLDEEKLKKEQAILYEQTRSMIDEGGWLGYLIPPSRELQGDAVMDQEHLELALKRFDEMWRTARPIEKSRTVKKS